MEEVLTDFKTMQGYTPQKAVTCGQYVKLYWSSINPEGSYTELPT